jgi:co-chaperonin GroES (HSP10)
MDREIFGTRLIADEIGSLEGKLFNNRVLVEVDAFIYESIETKSGLKLAIDPSWEVSPYSVRNGTVVLLPEKLIDWEQDSTAMSWKTDMDVRIGDKVWFYGMMSQDCEKLSFKGRKFMVLSYEDLYLAKRGEEVIMLNGNVLLEPIIKTVKALSFEQRMEDNLFAKVAYIGKNNYEYEHDKEDCPDLKVGMEVILHGYAVRHLEQEPYLFFDGKKYIICQNYEILGYLED